MSSVSESYDDIIEEYRSEFPRGTPFIVACENGSVEDVEAMIRAAGMDVTAMVNKVGKASNGDSATPLMMAARNEHSDIVKILLQCNADTATTNNDGDKDNALHFAAAYNKTTTTTVQLLLNNMKLEDINHKDTDGDTPLDNCYEYNDSSIKQQLIDLIRQNGGKRASELAEAERIKRISLLPKEEKEKLYKTLNEEYKNESPNGTPLVCACEKGRVEDVEFMIRGARAAGMDVTAMVSELGTSSKGSGWTPLMAAARYEHSTIIEILLQYNADTATTDKHGSNALHFAAWNNKTTTTTVGLLLNNMKLEDINHKDIIERTPLDYCYANNSSIKQQLIDLIRQQGGKRKSDLRIEAEIKRIRSLSKEEKEKLYKTLNEKYKKEFPKGTPFVCACDNGSVEDVGVMIKAAPAAGMDVTAMVSELGTDSAGDSYTPLMVAAWNEHSTIIEILLQYNADPATTTNDYGCNALHWAAYKNKTTTTIVRLLLNKMELKDINHKDRDGDTPLDYCYKYNDSSIQQQLIDLIRQKGGKREMELPAMLGEFYTLHEFRTQIFPIEADRLTFTVPGKDVDCDVGDYETTKYMPVKLKVESEDEDDGGEESENNWDKDGDKKLFLFCAKELKKYLNTPQGFYGLSTETANIFFENFEVDGSPSLPKSNPFNKKIIIGIQYLTQAEIETEQAKYTQLKSENKNVEDNRKKIEEDNNKKAYADGMELLANNSLLSILRKRLENARSLLAEQQSLLTEEEAKNSDTMTSRERKKAIQQEIDGARNRILDLKQRIRREEEKEEQRRLKESKRKNSSSVTLKNKRQRRNLYLKLSNLKF